MTRRPPRPGRAAPRDGRRRRGLPSRRALQLRPRRRRSDGAHQRRGHARRDRGGRRAPRRAHVLVRDVRARRRPARDRGGRARARGNCAIPYKRTKIAGERIALEAAARGADVVVVNPTTPVGPGDLRPTPTGKMVADVAGGRARAYLAGSALNIVAVEDVARGHLLAHERGVAGRRYLLGGENLEMREVFATIARAAGRRPPRARGAVERRLRGRLGRRAPARRALAAGPRRGPRRAPADALRRLSRAPRAGLHLLAGRGRARARRLGLRGPAPGGVELLASQRLALAIRAALRSQPADDEADHREQRAEQQHRRRRTAAPRYRAIGAGRTRRGRERRSVRPGCGVDAPPPA